MPDPARKLLVSQVSNMFLTKSPVTNLALMTKEASGDTKNYPGFGGPPFCAGHRRILEIVDGIFETVVFDESE
jgi:hypothetical protein